MNQIQIIQENREIIELERFYMDATPVTNDQFENFVNKTGYRTTAEIKGAENTWRDALTEGKENHPVVNISFNDAQAFAKYFGSKIPTESQWLVAAGNSTYPWGEDLIGRATWNANDTTPVKMHEPNELGIYDLAGNVWEWTSDQKETSEGLANVRKGGAYNIAEAFRLENQTYGLMKPSEFWPNLGFRTITPKHTLETALEEAQTPMIADGGGVEVLSLEGNIATIKPSGACCYCPSQNRSFNAFANRVKFYYPQAQIKISP